MFKFIAVVILIFSSAVQTAEMDVLSVDRAAAADNIHLSFANEQKIYPKQGDFAVNNYVLMSNEKGERWAVITVTNLSSGSRTLEHNHLMALFANGDRGTPVAYQEHFAGNETQSITVSFGVSKFPILSVYSSQNE
ncbi:hypothetical protein [Psychromonas aquimarina]|uniref:hypothetical protein n=1 Tax=Psychromonas aquimarina TaxID=444919 RepID=UPI0003FA2DD5|nr:hypothetical protein [Psychromonas aquimarina]